MKKVFLAVTLAAILGLVGCSSASTSQTAPQASPPVSTPSTTTSASPAPQVFKAVIMAVNKSGVKGEATVRVNGTTMQVEISATGLVPGKTHAQHIHGMPNSASACPPASSVIIPESGAEKYYGQVLVALEPFATASAAGATTYSASVEASSAAPGISVLPLEGRAIVLHGLMVKGKYDPSVPVGCGELKLQP